MQYIALLLLIPVLDSAKIRNFDMCEDREGTVNVTRRDIKLTVDTRGRTRRDRMTPQDCQCIVRWGSSDLKLRKTCSIVRNNKVACAALVCPRAGYLEYFDFQNLRHILKEERSYGHENLPISPGGSFLWSMHHRATDKNVIATVIISLFKKSNSDNKVLVKCGKDVFTTFAPPGATPPITIAQSSDGISTSSRSSTSLSIQTTPRPTASTTVTQPTTATFASTSSLYMPAGPTARTAADQSIRSDIMSSTSTSTSSKVTTETHRHLGQRKANAIPLWLGVAVGMTLLVITSGVVAIVAVTIRRRKAARRPREPDNSDGQEVRYVSAAEMERSNIHMRLGMVQRLQTGEQNETFSTSNAEISATYAAVTKQTKVKPSTHGSNDDSNAIGGVTTTSDVLHDANDDLDNCEHIIPPELPPKTRVFEPKAVMDAHNDEIINGHHLKEDCSKNDSDDVINMDYYGSHTFDNCEYFCGEQIPTEHSQENENISAETDEKRKSLV